MHGVAVGYPKFVRDYERVMSLEDFLAVHSPATTGRHLLRLLLRLHTQMVAGAHVSGVARWHAGGAA